MAHLITLCDIHPYQSHPTPAGDGVLGHKMPESAKQLVFDTDTLEMICFMYCS